MSRDIGRSRGARWAIAATAAVGLVVLAVTLGTRDGPSPEFSLPEAADPASPVPADQGQAYSVPEVPAPSAPTRGLKPVAQSYSPYCETPQGVCTLPSALPIGSPCDCAGTPGRVVP